MRTANLLNKINYPVIAIVGMCGAGKSVLTQMFVDKGWNCVYFGSVTLNEVAKRNLESNPHNEKIVREELRSQHGLETYAKILLPEIKELSEKRPTVLDGLYSWSEYRLLKAELGERLMLIAVIANTENRYSRLNKRLVRPLSKKEAIERDYAEIENLEKGGPIAISDIYIVNNSTAEEFTREFNRVYGYIHDYYQINGFN